MQTRRDQLQAYQFLVRRILAALLGNEPEAPEQPMRRAKAATFSGVMLGAIACGAVALTGLLTSGSSATWQDEANSLVIDKVTKQKYIYKNDGKKILYPVVNYISAQLLLNTDQPTIKEVPPENLAGVARGGQIGITDIPDALPTAESVTEGPWLVCNHMPSASEREVDLFVDHAPPKGSTELTDQTVVIQDERNQKYLLWAGKRLAVDDDTLVNLSMQREQPVVVKDAWLNVLPQGSDLKPITIPNVGTATTMTAANLELVVGQVLKSTNSTDPYWVVLEDGIAPITETQANLIVKDPTVAAATGTSDFQPTSDANLSGVPQTQVTLPTDHPDALPKPVDSVTNQTPVCLSYEGDPAAPLKVNVGGTMPRPGPQSPEGQPTGPAADNVTVVGGEVAVIATLGADDNPSGWAVVTDTGLKYPVPGKDVLGILGYGEVEALHVPKPLADLIRTGPALDPSKAGLSAGG